MNEQNNFLICFYVFSIRTDFGLHFIERNGIRFVVSIFAMSMTIMALLQSARHSKCSMARFYFAFRFGSYHCCRQNVWSVYGRRVRATKRHSWHFAFCLLCRTILCVFVWCLYYVILTLIQLSFHSLSFAFSRSFPSLACGAPLHTHTHEHRTFIRRCTLYELYILTTAK